jgi:hypothetical protein
MKIQPHTAAEGAPPAVKVRGELVETWSDSVLVASSMRFAEAFVGNVLAFEAKDGRIFAFGTLSLDGLILMHRQLGEIIAEERIRSAAKRS